MRRCVCVTCDFYLLEDDTTSACEIERHLENYLRVALDPEDLDISVDIDVEEDE